MKKELFLYIIPLLLFFSCRDYYGRQNKLVKDGRDNRNVVVFLGNSIIWYWAEESFDFFDINGRGEIQAVAFLENRLQELVKITLPNMGPQLLFGAEQPHRHVIFADAQHPRNFGIAHVLV